MLGLITAAKNFIERPGVSFSTYAKIRIKGEIVDYLRKNSNLCRTTITNKQKYERIIENLRNFKSLPLLKVLNTSINNTLSRTITVSYTHLTLPTSDLV